MSIDLYDWALSLIKSRDIFEKNIVKIEKTTLGFKVHKKEIVTDCLIIPKIDIAKELLGFLHEEQE